MLDHLHIETTAVDSNQPSKMPKTLARKDRDWHYKSREAVICGASQIICGLLCILLGSAAVAISAAHSQIGAGIWGGVIILAAGCCGVWSAREKTHRSVLICFVMSLLAALCSFLIFVVAGFGIAADAEHVNDTSLIFRHIEKTPENKRFAVGRYSKQVQRASIAVHGLIITVAMFELVASISQAVMCRYRQWCNRKAMRANGELAVIYETEKDTKSHRTHAREPRRPKHFISRDQPLCYVDVPECPRVHSDKPNSKNYNDYSDSNKTEYASSVSSARHGRVTNCDKNSVFDESDMESAGACSMDHHKEALLRSHGTEVNGHQRPAIHVHHI